MRSAFLGNVYPWLLPTAVTLLLVLSFVGAERVKRNTVEWKFSRIYFGMDQARVREILGPPSGRAKHGLINYEVWDFADGRMIVDFDDKNRVLCKSLGVVDGSGYVLPIDWRQLPRE